VTRGGKLFATVYILVGGTILLNNMSLISMIPLELRKRRIERAVLTQFGDHLDDAALRELATGPLIQRLHLSASRTDGLDECTREMFSLAMLVRLGKVNEQDIRETFASFRRLDVNDEGVLNSKSIIAAMIQKRRNQQQQLSQHIPPPPSYTPQPPQEQSAAEQEQEEANVWIDEHGGAPHNLSYYRDPEAGTNESSSLLQHHLTTPDSSRRLGRKSSQESPF
jgi:alkylhydroperoxidase/carboxymuconolactone decarboxylase family protein YurZ